MSAFLDRYQGFLAGVRGWDDLDRLWQTIRQQGKGWYLYAVGESIPESTANPAELEKFVGSIDQLLHREHAEDYCGIVYVDDPDQPALVKIYDPNNLGMVCGFSQSPTLPGWVMSLDPPVDLPDAFPQVAGRRRWWRRLFS